MKVSRLLSLTTPLHCRLVPRANFKSFPQCRADTPIHEQGHSVDQNRYVKKTNPDIAPLCVDEKSIHEISQTIIKEAGAWNKNIPFIDCSINVNGPSVSEDLLDAGFTNVEALTRFSDEENAHADLIQRYPNNFKVFPGDYTLLRKSYYKSSDQQEFDLWSEVMYSPSMNCGPEGQQEKNWKDDEPPLRLFAIIGDGKGSEKGNDIKTLTHLIYSMPKKMGFFERGRSELFYLISGRALYKAVTAPRDSRFYWPFTILMAAMFEVDVLNKIDRRHLQPFWTMPAGNLPAPYDRDHMFLLRIRPRANIFDWMTSGNEPKDAFGFVHFVNQLMQTQTSNVFQRAEIMCPGLPKILVSLGYTPQHTARDLVVYDFVVIYKEMIRQPDFEETSFRSELDQFMNDGAFTHS